MNNNAKHLHQLKREAKEEARNKKFDQKEHKRLLLLGIEHHLQIRSIYGP